jgi:iron complex outermembrane receptor protein
MAKSRNLQHAVRYALAAMAVAAAPAGYAQTQTQPTAAAAALEEVVVTGSRLKTANEVSISPITTVTAGDIAATGLTRAEDLLNNLPMVFAAQGSTIANGSDGTATVNLRGLGPQRSLVLVNGRRLGPGSADGRNYADVNQVPAALIEKIDVLTGGASAVYGADAVAGVVNFVLNTKFEGVKVDANYDYHQHHNGNSVAGLVTKAGDQLPPGNVNTGFSKDVSFLVGSNFADGKGNATFFATYTSAQPVLQAKYDYSACTLNSPSKAGVKAGKGPSCGGSGTAATGYFQAYGNTGAALFTNTVDKATGAFRPFNFATDLYNYGPINYYQRPSERYTAGTFVNYDVTSHVNAYAEFMFSRNTSVAQIAASGDFFLLSKISCANPLLTAAEKAAICSPANLAAQGSTTGINMYIGRRNVEGGGRQATFASDSYRTVIGLKGDFGEAWTFDAYGQYGTTQISDENLNYLSNTKIQNALNVVTNPATGQPVCQSVLDKTDTACVPWNIWVPGQVTKAATNYLALPLLISGDVTEQIVSGSVTGDFGKYGVKLPSAATGLQANLGIEWREEGAHFRPDEASQEGIAAGSGGKTVPVAGGFTVRELFTELRLPLIDNAPGAESLAAEGGYRYSDYSLGFNTNTYKLGLEWAPVRDVRARGSFNRAVRAPNVLELFQPQAVALDGTSDPCAGATPTPTAAQCAFSGVTPAEYGHISANPASQYNGLLGGNTHLLPEVADTYSLGLVFQPRMVPNLTLSIDYFDIKIKETIGPIGEDTILGNCISTGSPVYCGAVQRSSSGSLWKSNSGFVSDLNVNFGALSTKGIDIKGSYRLDMKGAGSLAFTLDGTKVNSLITQPLTNGASFDCVGYFGAKCSFNADGPSPKWRHIFNTTWNTPWQALSATLRWRYFGAVASERTSSDPQLAQAFYPGTSHIPAYNYFDLSAALALKEKVTFRLGVNNLLDKDPPIVLSGALSDCPTGPCNGNTYSQVYETLGRYVYGHVTVQF